MNRTVTLSSAFLLAGFYPLAAQQAAKELAPKAETKTEVPAKLPEAKPKKEIDRLTEENKLAAERLTRETNKMRAEITRLKMERELLTETLALEKAKRQSEMAEDLAEMQIEKDKLTQEAAVAKVKAEKLVHQLKVAQTESAIQVDRLKSELVAIQAKQRREEYADSDPVYLQKPLRDDSVLVISDRRIPLNGVISDRTADYITERIQFWNNKNSERPIFIVIDSSPGGSVMAGYRILKAMESSDAPIHVVVKSFAASMAAGITTLAEESYAYPNAVMLHHQISIMAFGRLNLTQQKELHEESERWWERLGNPIAEKMRITADELIKRMYEKSTSGDWSEFGTEAKKLKWVKHIVEGIDETSVIKNPDAKKVPTSNSTPSRTSELEEQVDAEGKPFVWLPRLQPKDVYFLYNPDGYYRLR